MKRLISLLLILLICLALTVACKEDKTDGEEGITSENIEETTTIVTTEEKKFEFVARSDNSKLKEGEYVTISSVDSKYVKSKT